MTRRKHPQAVTPSRPPGYRPKKRTRELVCDWDDLAPEEGSPPLTVTVQTNLSFEQLDAIPSAMRPNENGDGVIVFATDKHRAAIAPYVLEWNAEAVNEKTGEAIALPPPAEAGPDIFRALDWQVAAWLAVRLKTIQHLPAPELAEKKELTESSPATVSE
jgi:hypothetical protein